MCVIPSLRIPVEQDDDRRCALIYELALQSGIEYDVCDGTCDPLVWWVGEPDNAVNGTWSEETGYCNECWEQEKSESE